MLCVFHVDQHVSCRSIHSSSFCATSVPHAFIETCIAVAAASIAAGVDISTLVAVLLRTLQSLVTPELDIPRRKLPVRMFCIRSPAGQLEQLSNPPVGPSPAWLRQSFNVAPENTTQKPNVSGDKNGFHSMGGISEVFITLCKALMK